MPLCTFPAGSTLASEYRLLFNEFMRRFSDRHPSVRLAMLAWAHRYLMVSSDGHSAEVTAQVCAAVHKLLLDFDERVRLNACATLCQVAIALPAVVPNDYLQVCIPLEPSRLTPPLVCCRVLP